MSDDKKNEAPLPVKKMMQQHAASDSWKAAQNALKNQPAKPAQPQQPWKKEPEQEFDFEPGSGEDLKLANEMGAANVAGFQAPMTDEQAMEMVRELIKKKVKEVVRKAPGGAGYTLYAPNKGKKGKPRAVGHFPTKLGAKRAELARFPPKDQGKLSRLRKEVDKLTKDPRKAAEREKKAKERKSKKHENVTNEAPVMGGSPAFAGSKSASEKQPDQQRVGSLQQGAPTTDMRKFMDGLKAIPKEKSTDRANYVQKHINDPKFVQALNAQPGGQEIMKKLYSVANSSGVLKKGVVGGLKNTGSNESLSRRKDFMERVVISRLITKSLTESLFREEKTESEWDDYITKLSKNALAGDSKFQNLQKNISRKTEGMLNSAFNTIKKSVGKDVKLKNFGIKHDDESGQTYLAFSAEFSDVTAEPIYVHVEGGVPKIDLSQNAKVALTKADPNKAKLFRAELVTVQERVLDEMDEISKAIGARDKYLDKLQADVDGYVAGLSPLQVSLLKQLLVKKYRKL